MTSKEFLSMHHNLDVKIDSRIREVSHLREMSLRLSSPTFEEKVSGGQQTDAPFVRLIDKVVDLEREIDSEIDTLVSVHNDIRNAIESVEDPRQQAVLNYRYLQNMKWQEIANALFADRTSVYRWHKQALEQIKIPKIYANP
jgi:DNA-directed RNA polymerase specialized sigma subunit